MITNVIRLFDWFYEGWFNGVNNMVKANKVITKRMALVWPYHILWVRQ